MRTAHPTPTRAASTRAASAAVEPDTYRSAHPALRSVSPATVDARRDTSHVTTCGANATEVDAVAHLIEAFAPEVTVRAVSRRRDTYVVRAVASRRTRLYRIPVDMVPRAGRLTVTPGADHAA